MLSTLAIAHRQVLRWPNMTRQLDYRHLLKHDYSKGISAIILVSKKSCMLPLKQSWADVAPCTSSLIMGMSLMGNGLFGKDTMKSRKSFPAPVMGREGQIQHSSWGSTPFEVFSESWQFPWWASSRLIDRIFQRGVVSILKQDLMEYLSILSSDKVLSWRQPMFLKCGCWLKKNSKRS